MESSRTFLNLNIDEAKLVHRKVYFNAKRLRKDSRYLASIKSFPTANTLAILSLEEVIKATILLLHSQKILIYRVKGAKKFFSDHKIRHDLAMIFEVITGSFEAIIEGDNNKKTRTLNTGIKWLDSFFEKVPTFLNKTLKISKSIIRANGFTKYNQLKNNGLYCDYRNGFISPLQNVTKRTYQETSESVERMFNFYQSLKLLTHKQASIHVMEVGYEDGLDEIRNMVNKWIIDS